MNRDRHMSAEELLRFADGETSFFAKRRAQRHLAACWDCRAKLRESENTISEIVALHHRTLDPQLPSARGPRAVLKARIVQMADAKESRWLRLPDLSRGAAALLVLFVVVWLAGEHWIGANANHSRLPATSPSVEPDRHLTPGAARLVSTEELCAGRYSDDTGAVPSEVRRQVLQEYGLASQQADNYELDYLISPQLGGTQDISNLWPEPAASTAWNTQAKDALENRLHQMVCRGNISLATAQQDLATDWVSAYKKYFHSAQPVQPL